jgi:spectinomycin phosphotransferase
VREPPELADDAIVGALEASFGIRVRALAFLPVGNDAASWAYRVQAARGQVYFLKVRADADRVPGAVVPAHLQRLGVPHVLAPLASGAGAPNVLVGGFALALYPMLDARAGADGGLSARQWRQLGDAVRRVHAVRLPPELARLVGREAFRPSRRELIPDLEALLAGGADDPLTSELAGSWRARQGVIDGLVQQADELGRHLARLSFPQVLCHADLHTRNVLVDADEQPWIVDWDEVTLAPRERDLMFVVGGGIGHGMVRPGDTDRFFEGYGQVAVDPRLLAYYRIAWAVQDIAACGEQVLLLPAVGEVTRRAAVDGFVGMFRPGNIVDLALGGPQHSQEEPSA